MSDVNIKLYIYLFAYLKRSDFDVCDICYIGVIKCGYLIILMNASVQKIVIQVVAMLFCFCIALVQVCGFLLRFTEGYI